MITFAPPPPSPHLRQSRSSTSTTGSSSSTTRSPSPYPFPDQKLHFPNPAVSVISAISHHAKRTCKQFVSVRGRHSDHSGHSHDQAPNMAKMRVVTPVYDHGLERWVWPDSARIDEEEEEKDDDEKEWRERRRSGSHGGSFTSSRTSTSS